MALGGLLYVLAYIAGALVVLFVGSALLRASAALASKTIGPAKRDEPIGWDWDAEEDDEEALPPSDEPAIPEPGIGTGMRILFLAAFLQLLAIIILQFVLRELVELRRGMDSPPGVVLGVASWFLLLSAVAALMLPTSFRRAALVSLYFSLILLLIVVFVRGLAFVAFL